MTTPGVLAKFVFVVGLIALAALPAGALGHRFGLWDYMMGTAFVFSGTVLAVIALVLGVAALVFSRTRNRSADRRPALVGTVASIFVLGLMAMYYDKAVSSPLTYDISTDRTDPPGFQEVPARRGPDANPLAYTQEKARLQAEGYPDIVGVRSTEGTRASLDKASAVARELGWEVVNEDPALGIVEASDRTFWFGFTDDIVIRVRAEGDGSRVDLRSVSRVGLTDLGANANRIRGFLDRWDAP